MGNITAKLKLLLWPEVPVRVLMVGLDGAGKTTILYKLKLGEVIQSLPTVGFNVEEVNYKNLNFTVWDIGGQDRIRKLWRYYFQNTDVVIYVVDSNDRERLEEARFELHSMLKDHELANSKILIYANKTDLPNSASVNKVASILDLNSLKQRDWYIQQCTALSGEGLVEGLDWCSRAMNGKTACT